MGNQPQDAVVLPAMPGRIEDRGVGAVIDDRVGSRQFKPVRRMVIPQPLRYEHREIGKFVDLRQQVVDEVCPLPLVALVHSVQYPHVRIDALVGPDLLEGDQLVRRLSRIHDNDQVRPPVQVVSDLEPPAIQQLRHLYDELIAAPPGSSYRLLGEDDPGHPVVPAPQDSVGDRFHREQIHPISRVIRRRASKYGSTVHHLTHEVTMLPGHIRRRVVFGHHPPRLVLFIPQVQPSD